MVSFKPRQLGTSKVVRSIPTVPIAVPTDAKHDPESSSSPLFSLVSFHTLQWYHFNALVAAALFSIVTRAARG